MQVSRIGSRGSFNWPFPSQKGPITSPQSARASSHRYTDVNLAKRRNVAGIFFTNYRPKTGPRNLIFGRYFCNALHLLLTQSFMT